ncbi:MAG: phosphodiester glycosidase family protein [Candidatus Pacebacteria bacterium]|nr:phosphodiester glycosidase family protein [Candidatus Paceibacterota bacterium]
MKKLFILTLLATITFVANAQNEIVYRTHNPNVGFGKASNCSTNEFMDFCVNGPLVGDNNSPVGGYIDNSNTIQEWVLPESGGGNFAVGNSIFGLDKEGHFHMCSFEERNTLPEMVWAFQNGPALVQNGKNVRGTSTTKFSRSGIGYDSKGTLVVIVSLRPVTFYEFADLFVKENCINAIFLDGGPYVGFSDNTKTYGMVSEAMKLQFFNN